jgi:hypothetical protein
MHIKNKNVIGLIPVLLLVSGCATITKDANQSVQIETYSKDNQPVAGVKCVAQNDRGQWNTSSPGSVSVHRSSENLLVNCEKEGEQPGKGTVVSRVNGGMFGNIVFGGGIGAIIDHNKGTAYTYPSWIRIIMGDNLVYDRKHETENQPVTGIAATGQEEAAPATTAAAASTTAAAPAQ